MTAVKWQAIRAERGRFPLVEGSDLTITNADDGTKMRVKGIDVSKRGIGFMSDRPLTIGKHFWLDLGDKRISVEIMHCESYLGIDNMFRCGAFSRDAAGDLAEYFAKNNLLASTTPMP